MDVLLSSIIMMGVGMNDLINMEIPEREREPPPRDQLLFCILYFTELYKVIFPYSGPKHR